MRQVNVGGTEIVLEAARAAGAETIVHVSSVVALAPTGGAPLATELPVGRPRERYMATKAAAEEVARRHQAAGAPVVITYPMATLGPHTRTWGISSPGCGPCCAGGCPSGPVADSRSVTSGTWPTCMSPRCEPGRGHGGCWRRGSGCPPGSSSRRYARSPGVGCRSATCRRRRCCRWGRPHPRCSGSRRGMSRWSTARSTPATAICVPARRCPPPPARSPETIRDTVAWLHRAGLISRRQAGLAVDPR